MSSLIICRSCLFELCLQLYCMNYIASFIFCILSASVCMEIHVGLGLPPGKKNSNCVSNCWLSNCEQTVSFCHKSALNCDWFVCLSAISIQTQFLASLITKKQTNNQSPAELNHTDPDTCCFLINSYCMTVQSPHTWPLLCDVAPLLAFPEDLYP